MSDPSYGRFRNQVVVVTGASRGLGRGCAEAFAAEGAQVVLIARASPDLDQAVESILQQGGAARAIACDVTRAAEVQRAFAELERCDVLINNADGNRPQPFLEVDLDTLDTYLSLNVRALFVAAQAAARRMVDTGSSGVIINMSSQMGHVGGPNRTVYCMTKHAVEGLTKAMALDLASHGIRVNSVAPTYVETPMTRPFFADGPFRQDVLRRIPLGRLGTIEEVTAAVLFLASPAASLITGTSLLVDGGYTAQ
jgi:NAD(P)-dependent dehydrogenase (short-subunit alcohol dehydrogenase family)